MADDNPYANIIEDDINRQQITASRNSVGTQSIDPDQAARAIAAEPVTGVPAAASMADPTAVTQASQLQRNQAITSSSPAVAQWAAGDPARVAATKDDFPSLAKLGQQIDGYFKPVEDWGSAAKAAVDQFTQDYNASKTKPVRNIGDFAKELTVGGVTEAGSLAKALYDIPSGAFSTAVAPAVNAAARAYADLPLKMFNDPTIFNPGGKYEELTPEQRYAEGQNLANQILTVIGNKDSVAAKSAAMFEGDFAEAFRNAKTVPPEPTARLEGPRETSTPSEVIPEPGTDPQTDSIRSILAEADDSHIADTQDTIAQSKTQARLPSLTEEFINQQAPDSTVHVNGEVLANLQAKGESPFLDLTPQIQSAAERGGDVEIPLGKYLSESAGQPWADEVRAATRFREDGFSKDEAGELSVKPQEEAEAVASEQPAETVPDIPRQQIEQQVRAQYLSALFKDPESAGMTTDQFSRYSAKLEAAIQDATYRLQARGEAAVKRELSPAFKERAAQLRPTVERELSQRPDLLARHTLTYAKTPLEEPTSKVRLGRQDAVDAFGENVVKELPAKWFTAKSEIADARGTFHGADLDTIADEFGFSSGEDMLRQLKELQLAQTFSGNDARGHFKSLVEEETANRVRDELGYRITPEEIKQAASEALNTPKLTDFLAQELKALSKQIGRPFEEADITNRAQQLFDGMEVRSALRIKDFERTAMRTGRNAEVALLKGKVPEAFKAKTQQLINSHMLQMSHDLNKLFSKTEKQWARFARNSTIEGLSQEYLNHIHATLNQIGYPINRNRVDLEKGLGGKSLTDFINSKITEGADLINARVLPADGPSKLLVSEFTGLQQMISSLATQGRLEGLFKKGEEEIELQKAIFDFVHRLELREKYIDRQEIQNPTWLNKVESSRRFADAWLVRAEQLFLDLGGRDPDSVANSIVMDIQSRKGWSDDRRVELAQHFHDLNKELGKGFDSWLKVRVEEPAFLDSDGNRLFGTNKDILIAALHYGDAAAWDKFNRGFNFDPVATEKMIMTRMTEQGWKFAQGIWDAFGKLQPEIEQQYRARTGVAPSFVVPREVKTSFGKFSGGYFPVLYDYESLPKSVRDQMDPMEFLGQKDYIRATPSNSYAKERTGFASPVRMNLDGVHYRLNQVIHDLAYRDVLINANKILTDSAVRKAIAFRYGPEYLPQIDCWLRAIAGAEGTSLNKNDFVSNMLNNINNSTMTNFIGYSVKTLMKHASGAFAASVNEVGLVPLLSQYQRLAKDLKLIDYVSKNSPEIRHRLLNANEQARTAYLNLLEKQGVMSLVGKYAFHLVGWSDQFSAIPTWLAAEARALAQNPDPERAFRLADQAVRQAHGSGGKIDQPTALRASNDVPGQLWAMTNRFLTLFNHMYNRTREIPQAIGSGAKKAGEGDYAGARRDFAYAAGNTFAYILITAIIEEVTKGQRKKAETWVAGLAKALIYQPFSGIPLLHQFVAAALGEDDSGTGIVQAGKSVYQTAKDTAYWHDHDGQVPPRFIEHALDTVGWFSAGKFPGHTVGKAGQYISDFATGRERPASPWGFVTGIVGGPQKDQETLEAKAEDMLVRRQDRIKAKMENSK
jgi:hypothetical protein